MSRSQLRKTAILITLSLALLLATGLITEAQDVKSGNGEYAVKTDSSTDRKVVYRVLDNKEWYSIPNVPGQIFLSEDGTYAAVCNHWLSQGYKKNDVVVQFYRTQSPVTGLRLTDLLDRPKSLRSEGTHYRWGQCAGFLRDTLFAIDTIESQRVAFDPASGQRNRTSGTWPPKVSPPPPTTAAVVTRLRFLDRWCEGDDYQFCDDFIGGMKNGWQQVRGKWMSTETHPLQPTSQEIEWVLHQRSDLAREGNALMYYDPQNFADFDIHTLIRMDLTFPQLAIDEDDIRIRRLRRIAGAGVVFRFQDANNYYMFRLAGEEGAVLGKMQNGEWFDLANPRAVDFLNSNLRYKDRYYGLRVRVRGDRIECFIMETTPDSDPVEQAVVNLRDTSFSTGRIGVVTFEASADFLYVQVNDL